MRRSMSLLITLVWIAFVTAPLAAGEMVKETIESAALGGKKLDVNVLLPDGYGDEAAKEKHYPVVYLLHGYGGDYTEWARVGVAERAAGLDVILVMPEGDKSFWFNHHENAAGRWDDWVTSEVVPFIDGKYRTIASRAARGISGLSMGGYGAMALGLVHPELFASIASHSGALTVPGFTREGEIGRRLTEIFGPDGSEARKKYDLVRLIGELPADRRPDIYVDCGAQDFLLEANRTYVAELSRRRAVYIYREVPGAHDFAYWRENVRRSLEHQLGVLSPAGKPAPRPAAAPVASAWIAGEWSVVTVLPNGDASPSTLTIRQSGEKVTASARWDSGSLEIDKGSVKDDRLKLEAAFERDGATVVIRVDAKLEGDKLDGKWSVSDSGDAELYSGDWTATAVRRDPPPAASAAKPAPAAAAPTIAGAWDLILTLQETEIDYTLRLEGGGDALRGVIVSPRSGEHPIRKATFAGDKLRLEIDRSIEGNPVTFIYDGKLAGGALSGSVTLSGLDGYSGSFKATRKPAAGDTPRRESDL